MDWLTFIQGGAAMILLVAIGYLLYALLNMLHANRRAPMSDIESLRVQMEALQRRLEALESRQPQAAPVGEDEPFDAPYASAARMLNDGIPCEEVAGRLGMSRAEVELIAVLRRESNKP